MSCAQKQPDQKISLAGGGLRYYHSVVDDHRGLVEQLGEEIDWQQHQITLFGRTHSAPRLSAWMGDANASYQYSGLRLTPVHWSPAVAALRDLVTAICEAPFNSVLLNLYRDGNDAMGWHSDDEPELGPSPMVASLSLGETRRFSLKHRNHAEEEGISLDLPGGSLLIMDPPTQQNWRHCVRPTRRAVGARINLTFREIVHS